MKNLKNLLSIFAVAGLFATGAFAQSTSENATVSAEASIVSAITVANNADLLFGDILTSETPTIAATAANAGSVSITGATNGQTLNISAVFPATLTDGTPANDLDLGSYDIAVRTDGTDDATGATSPGDEATATQTVTGSFTATTNTMYVYVGAQITDASSGVAGNDYSNDITVTDRKSVV